MSERREELKALMQKLLTEQIRSGHLKLVTMPPVGFKCSGCLYFDGDEWERSSDELRENDCIDCVTK